MRHAGRRKQEISGAELRALISKYKFAAAADDDVSLVSRVRRLRIASSWGVDLDGECSVLEHFSESLTLRARQTG